MKRRDFERKATRKQRKGLSRMTSAVSPASLHNPGSLDNGILIQPTDATPNNQLEIHCSSAGRRVSDGQIAELLRNTQQKNEILVGRGCGLLVGEVVAGGGVRGCDGVASGDSAAPRSIRFLGELASYKSSVTHSSE